MNNLDDITNSKPTYDDFKQCNKHMVITLLPELYKLRARSQFMKTFDHLQTLLDIYCDSYIIVAELTQEGNVHYHIMLQFASHMPEAQYKFLDLMKLSRKFGKPFINRKIINDRINWERTIEYIFKEVKITERVINSHPKHDILDVWTSTIVHHTTTLQDHDDNIDKIVE